MGITIKSRHMKFYAREHELTLLEKLYSQCEQAGIMNVITGRRRIGKTALAKKFVENKKHLYFFISKKSERLLCKELFEALTSQFDVPFAGEVADFRTLFGIILELAQKQKFVLIIDEFQEFYHVNQSVYSEIQNLWDEYKSRVKLQVIFIGSLYSLMVKIFQNSHEPLFGRADRIIHLKPFTLKTIKSILVDHKQYSIENLFYNFVVTGGVPRYEDILARNASFSKKKMFDLYFSENSPFLDEGKYVLIDEFGKEYGTYFSILEMLSEGRTSRSEIESVLGRNIGGYLDRLENVYDIIKRVKPIGSKSASKVQKYRIKDNFLSFWFRFVFKLRSAIENENFKYIRQILERDLSTYSGPYLEKMFHQLLMLSGNYNILGNYWERGNQNEIDLVAINDLEKKMKLIEIKMNKQKLRLSLLQSKGKKLISKYPDYEIEFLGLSIEDVEVYLDDIKEGHASSSEDGPQQAP